MSEETVTMDSILSEDTGFTTDLNMPTTTLTDDSEMLNSTDEFFNNSITVDIDNSTGTTVFYSEYPEAKSVFQAFMITEIIMTALELIIAILAAIKIPRWRKNYRNQMLMQLSLARFIKRLILLFKFFEEHKKPPSSDVNTTLNISQIYIDFVTIVLVIFFIKHMYDSLIIVVVKLNQASLNKTTLCAWLLPVLITAIWSVIILTKVLDEWFVYLLICCLFRWPLIFLGTIFYITIVYKVLSDKIRRFARSLTIVTFLMCLVTNFYLFSKDIIELWCFKSAYLTILINYISGFLLNFFILCFYIILITLNFNHNKESSRSLPDYSIADRNKPR